MLNKTSKNLIIACVLWPFFIIAGCTTLASQKISELHYLSWQQREQELKALKIWTADGSLSIRYLQENDIVSYSWQQTLDRYQISIKSPLNIIHVDVIGDQNNVTMWRSAKEKLSASSPEKLLQKELGWELPISNLVYWIKGLPAPIKISSQRYTSKFDSYNHLTYLSQDGWEIWYSNYISVNKIDLPSKIDLINQNLKVRLVVKNWSIKP